jgi:hypothetical protein
MRINPEFRRNVWVQFTWTRLVAVPLLTIIVCYAFLLVNDRDYRLLQKIAEFVGGSVIVGLWGTRRAADSLAEEVSGGTWESQRMSGLGAWQMTWGKLLGSASFVWYCATIAYLVVLWASNRIEAAGGIGRAPLQVAFDFYVGGLVAQAAAFSIALLLLRKAARYRRLTITLAQTCGFLVYFLFVRGDFSEQLSVRFRASDLPSNEAFWSASSHELDLARVLAIGLTCLWSTIAAYRLMRTELQYRSLPWVWTLFLVFILAAGRTASSAENAYSWLALPFLSFVLLTYLSFFADNRDPVRYRWALLAVRDRNWFEVLSAVPWWLISYTFAAVSAVVIAWSLAGVAGIVSTADSTPALRMFLMAVEHPATSLALVMLFMLRDLLVMLWFSCSPWRAKADVAGIIYLALVYWPLAAILWISGFPHLLPVVAPIATGSIGADFVPIGIEIAFASFLFYARWREITRLEPRTAK